MKKNFSFLLLLSFCGMMHAQVIKTAERPSLVIGLMIDQMRWDYLSRYSYQFSETGFKRLLREGFSCDNVHIPYVPTLTAPGHTCVYTGSVPAIHGIAGNEWYDRQLNKMINSCDDSTVQTVGSTSVWGKMSPRNQLCTTVGDELKLNTNAKSKVISIALKDRASILPGGHLADAAYWYDQSAGVWISSTYYMNDLPQWVQQFNNKHLPDSMMRITWNTSKPVTAYKASTADDMPYESVISATNRNVFPHNINVADKDKYDQFRYTPFAMSYTFQFVQKAIEEEQLGADDVTDLLCLSISSTDLIGHKFGPNSVELEDMYIRLDKELSMFLSYLDKKFGRNNYMLFLTADHGVENVPAYLNDHHLPGGVTTDALMFNYIDSAVKADLQIKNALIKVSNTEVYINPAISDTSFITQIKATAINALNKHPYVVKAFATDKISQVNLTSRERIIFANSFYPKRSGDIYFMLRQGYISRSEKGTTHGSLYEYDTHIPLLWFGKNIPRGKSNREIFMTDIAPTLSSLLNIQAPACATGTIIYELNNNRP